MAGGGQNNIFQTELVVSSTAAASPPEVLKRLQVDSFFGVFRMFYLAATWFYDQPLDAQNIKQTMAALVTKMPALAGRRTKAGNIVLSNAGARFSVCLQHTGSAHNFTGAYQHVEPKRGTFTDYPPPGGKVSEAPLFTVRVTNFVDGTSAIGIASPHCLTDGKSYFQIVSAFATALSMDGSFELTSVPDFDCARVWEAAELAGDVRTEAASCCLFPSIKFLACMYAPMVKLMMRSPDKLMPRAKIHITHDELKQLKASVTTTLGDDAKAVTANEAISAALLVALADRWPKLKRRPAQLAMVANAQGKGAFADVKNVAGNFSIFVPKETSKPARQMTMADAARHFRAIGDDWRDPTASADYVDRYVGTFRYMDVTDKVPTSGRYKFPECDLIINNQSVYNVAQIRFGAGSLIGFCPWHSVDQLHIMASMEPPAPGAAPVSPSGAVKSKLARQTSTIKKLVGALDTKTAFERADADGSGTLSRGEIEAALVAAKVAVPPAELDAVFEMMDKDASGGIDPEEFNAAFYAVRLGSGIDVYIPDISRGKAKGLKVAYLESEEFKCKLLHGWKVKVEVNS